MMQLLNTLIRLTWILAMQLHALRVLRWPMTLVLRFLMMTSVMLVSLMLMQLRSSLFGQL
uniref:Uncharacterized protein n=1 Tax=uncultured marine virus TaxID=186617 RepID=A0A0F7LCK7_9VIRU|nr:hypothetical protein [uncultured marine virus]